MRKLLPTILLLVVVICCSDSRCSSGRIWCKAKKGCVPTWLKGECDEWDDFVAEKAPFERDVSNAEKSLVGAEFSDLVHPNANIEKQVLAAKRLSVDAKIDKATSVDAKLVSFDQTADVLPTLDDMELVTAANKAGFTMKENAAHLKGDRRAHALHLMEDELDKEAEASGAVVTQDEAFSKIPLAIAKSKKMIKQAAEADQFAKKYEKMINSAIASEERTIAEKFIQERQKDRDAHSKSELTSEAQAAMTNFIEPLENKVLEQVERKVKALQGEAAADHSFESAEETLSDPKSFYVPPGEHLENLSHDLLQAKMKAGLEKKKAMDEDALAKSAARKKSKMKAGNEMAFGKAEIQAVNEAMRVKLSPTHAPTLLPPCASENATQKSHALCSTPADRAKWKADQKRKASAPVHAAAPVMPPASEPSAGATRGGAAHNDAPDSALNDFLSSLKGIEGAVNSASTSSKQAQSIGGEHSLGGLLALVGAVICVGAATVGYELKKRGVNVIGGSGQQEYTSIPNGNTAIAEKPDSDEEV